MIDALVILFSAGMCIVIAYRALRLDAVLPWFGVEPAPMTGAQCEATGEPKGWRDRARANADR